MKITPLEELPDVKLIQHDVFSDERVSSYEPHNVDAMVEALGLDPNAADSDICFPQSWLSHSEQDVIHGFHYQVHPRLQGKLVKVITGEIIDVIVDVREDSPTFGHFTTILLSWFHNLSLWIPPGFAHAHLTVSPSSKVLYLFTQYTDPVCMRKIGRAHV